MKPARHASGERAASPTAVPDDPATPPTDIHSALSPERLAEAGLEDYAPVLLAPRRDGWTAERQRVFLTVLAETGSVSEACVQAGVSSRSAYRLRARPDAPQFAAGWDHALKLATVRLTALAFERATRGTVREMWRDGKLHYSTREPSDRLLTFLLQHLLPAGRPGERWTGCEAMTNAARASFPAALGALVDHPVEMVPIAYREYYGELPGDQDEDV